MQLQMKFIGVVAVGLALFATFKIAVADENNRPISGEKSILAMYVQSYGLAANGLAPHRLIFAAWDDGYVVWSENSVEGGIPYRAGRIDPAKLHAFLKKTHSDGLHQDASLAQPQFGPSSRTTVLLAKFEGNALKMQSWHELFELDGKVVATKGGVAPLDGRSRFDVLRQEPTDYLFYRFVWDELRLGAAFLTPSESKPVDGKLELRRGNAYWMQSTVVSE